MVIITYKYPYSEDKLRGLLSYLYNNNSSSNMFTDVLLNYFLNGIDAPGMPPGYFVEYIDSLTNQAYSGNIEYFFTIFKESRNEISQPQ